MKPIRVVQLLLTVVVLSPIAAPAQQRWQCGDGRLSL